MGMTITEKILAAHAGREEVQPGDIIIARVDLVLANELSGILAINEFEKIRGADGVFDPQKIVLVPDHFTPNKDIQTAAVTWKIREFARKHGVRYYEVGRLGIEHVLLPEEGLVGPGDLVIGGDSHTCTYGALGCFSTGVGSTDVAVAFALGEVWLKVPPTIKLVYRGKPGPWVGGKDLILYTIGRLGVDGALYHALEFSGGTFNYLTMADRFTMANMAVECGAKSGIFVPDGTILEYTRKAGHANTKVHHSDPDAKYARIVEINAETVEPQVALPHSPENARPVSAVAGITIDQVMIGSCTNGRIEDLRAAAALLEGRRVHERVRVIVIPGSRRVYLEALHEGLIEIFLESGCVVSTPTCGPCIGGHMGVLAAGERCLSTTNRNFLGRMGHPESEVYLAGPAVAAASAIAGCITHPAEIVSAKEADHGRN